MKGARSRHGWVLQTEHGLLGPLDLLRPELGRTADRDSLALEVAGVTVVLEAEPAPVGAGLGRLDLVVAGTVWPDHRVRMPAAPEDAVVIGDPTAPPFPLAASRFLVDDDPWRWRVDPALPLDESWHGACVLARSDGRLIGVFLCEDDDLWIALVPGATD